MYQQVNVNLERWIVYMSAIECHFQKRCIVRISGKALEKMVNRSYFIIAIANHFDIL